MKAMIKTQSTPYSIDVILFLNVFAVIIQASFIVLIHSGKINLIPALSNIPLSSTLIFGLLSFLSAQLFLWACFIGFQIFLLYSSQSICSNKKNSQYLAIAIVLASYFCLLLTNTLYYPHSQFSFPFSNSKIILSILSLCAIFCAICLLSRPKIGLPILLGVFFFIFWQNHQTKTTAFLATKQKNVIIIGLDAVRPDHVTETLMPHLHRFTQHAVNYENAFTPIARTYPAWMSILTGQTPTKNGAQYNLIDPSQLHFHETLGSRLHNIGYQTVFAMDERRFSRIDQTLGFDTVIGPPMGLFDFIWGTFNDWPLSNLIINTKLGPWLFPYNAQNRASSVQYSPSSFTQQITSKINSLNKNKPVFLAIHFCLAHWPYTWKTGPKLELHNKNDLQAHYDQCIKTVDTQFASLMKSLKKLHLLDNSIIIIVSDHGEGLGFQNDLAISPKTFDGSNSVLLNYFTHERERYPDLIPLAGHGTNILSLSQYRILFAIRNGKLKPQKISYPVSLIDIKPSVLQNLNQKDNDSEGIALLPLIHQKNNKPRRLTLETGITLPSLLSYHPNPNTFLKQTSSLFQIDPKTLYITVRPSEHKSILSRKQYATLEWPWYEAIFPINSKKIKVRLNLETKRWSETS